jgi:sulfate adenylyltransferase
LPFPAPHGGKLLTIKEIEASESRLRDINSGLRIVVDDETQTTIFNIASGVLSPLDGFMSEQDYYNVLTSMRLADDTPWTIPILLHAPKDFVAGSGDEIALVS